MPAPSPGSWVSAFAIAALLLVPVVGGCSDDGDDDLISTPTASADSGADTSARADGAAPASDGGASASTTTDAAGAPLGAEESGEATYYDPTGTSSCGFKGTSTSLVAAMNDEQYRKADCGKCVAVTGPKGTTVVPVVDKCPGCDRGDLDLSTNAFAKIAALSAGRVKITWRFVACP